jgi:hypothetical protein
VVGCGRSTVSAFVVIEVQSGKHLGTTRLFHTLWRLYEATSAGFEGKARHRKVQAGNALFTTALPRMNKIEREYDGRLEVYRTDVNAVIRETSLREPLSFLTPMTIGRAFPLLDDLRSLVHSALPAGHILDQTENISAARSQGAERLAVEYR